MEIVIQNNLNQLVIARDGYKIVDFLSDIGGMQSLIISGMGFILAIWNYNMLDNFMVSRLYKLATKPDVQDDEMVDLQYS